MSTAKVIRWGGLALMLGGIGFAVHLITHPPGETAPYAFYALWVPSHLLGGIASLLIALGLVGLYLRQSENVGVLGLIGFVLAYAGTTLAAGALIFLRLIIFTIPLAIVGSVLILFIGTSWQGLIQSILGVLLGLGLVAWGWALWSEKAA